MSFCLFRFSAIFCVCELVVLNWLDDSSLYAILCELREHVLLSNWLDGWTIDVHVIFTKLYGCFYCLCWNFIIIYHIYFDQNIRSVQNFSLGEHGNCWEGEWNGWERSRKKNARTNATKGLGVCLGHLNRERGIIVFSGVLISAKRAKRGLELIKQRNPKF